MGAVGRVAHATSSDHATQGVLHIRRSGALDLTSSLEAKFGARSDQLHQKLGKFCYYKTQKLLENPNFGDKSEIQRAKFGVFVTFIF